MSDDVKPVVSTLIRRPFAGAERPFQLRYGEILELERLCGAGIFALTKRMAAHEARVADIRETIRLGLVGGGMTDRESTELTLLVVDRRPLTEFLPIASDLLLATLHGWPEPEPEEAGAAKKAPAASAPLETPPPSTASGI